MVSSAEALSTAYWMVRNGEDSKEPRPVASVPSGETNHSAALAGRVAPAATAAMIVVTHVDRFMAGLPMGFMDAIILPFPTRCVNRNLATLLFAFLRHRVAKAQMW